MIPASGVFLVTLIIIVIYPNAQGATTDLPDIGHCDTTPYQEGQTAEMRFYFKNINTSSESFLVYLVRESDQGTHLAECYGENVNMVCKPKSQSVSVTNTRSELTVRIPIASKNFEGTYELKGFFKDKKLPPLSCTLKISGTQSEGETSQAWVAVVVISVLLVVAGVAAAVWCYRTKRFCFQKETPNTEAGNLDLNQTTQPLLDNKSGMDATSSEGQKPTARQDRTSGNPRRDGMEAPQNQTQALERQDKERRNSRDGMDVPDHKKQLNVRQETGPENIRSDEDATSNKGQETTARQDTTSEKPRYYFPTLTKEDEERLLLSERNGHGSFLVKSGKEKDFVILSVNWHGQIFHYRVTKHQSKFWYDKIPFESLDELTEYYKAQDIMYGGHNKCRLIKPVEQDAMSE